MLEVGRVWWEEVCRWDFGYEVQREQNDVEEEAWDGAWEVVGTFLQADPRISEAKDDRNGHET